MPLAWRSGLERAVLGAQVDGLHSTLRGGPVGTDAPTGCYGLWGFIPAAVFLCGTLCDVKKTGGGGLEGESLGSLASPEPELCIWSSAIYVRFCSST
jgi:hypothetical protein